MKVLFYIVVGVFILLGLGAILFIRDAKSDKLMNLLGGLTYLVSGVLAFLIDSWWILLIGFVIAFFLQYIINKSGSAKKKILASLTSEVKQRGVITDRFYSFISSQNDLSPILQKYNGTQEKINLIYQELIATGGGQWANGYYVATSCFAFPEPLANLLMSFDGKEFQYQNFDSYNSKLQITYDLCTYFDKM